MKTYFRWMYIVLFHLAVVFALAGDWVQTFGLAMLCLIIALQEINVVNTTNPRPTEDA